MMTWLIVLVGSFTIMAFLIAGPTVGILTAAWGFAIWLLFLALKDFIS